MTRSLSKSWLRLSDLCQQIGLTVTEANSTETKAFQDELAELLAFLPTPSGSIIEAEARALLAELRGDITDAIHHRTIEAELIEKLQKSITDEQRSSGLDEFILFRRTPADLVLKRKHLEKLRRCGEGLQ